MDVTTTADIERIPADFMREPFGLFARLRRDGPAHELVMPHGAKVWMVTRYDDVRALLNDPRLSKDGRRANEMFAKHSACPVGDGSSRFDDELTAHMLNSDPPRHTRLRNLVSSAFTVRRAEAMRPRIEQVVDELLDAVAGPGEVDLIRTFAEPLSFTIMLDVVGVPQREREAFRRWSYPLVGGGDHAPDVVAEASRQLAEYSHGLIEAKRANPDDTLVGALVRACDEAGRISPDEIVSMIFLLVAAGSDTPGSQLGNAVHDLLTHPEQLARLRADLSAMPAAVDELLRFNSGIATASFRFTVTDVAVGGVVIPAGEIVLLSVSAANRDSNRFPDADRLDLSRRPVGGLAFGHGIHYCTGAPLARVSMSIALTRLLTRFPDIRLATGPERLRWRNSTLVRGLDALPVLVS